MISECSANAIAKENAALATEYNNKMVMVESIPRLVMKNLVRENKIIS